MAAVYVSHTKDVTRQECLFTWTIDNFASLSEETGCYLESPEFGDFRLFKWRIQLYPRGIDEECGNYISVGLTTNVSKNLDSKYRKLVMFFILDSKNEMQEIARMCAKIDAEVLFRHFYEIKLPRTYRNNDPNNKITMYCQVNVFETIIVLNPRPPSRLEPPACSLAEDLSTLLDSGEHHDVTLNAGGREVRAHKNILAARSPVFASMFKHEFAEKKENSVHIEDMSFEVLMEVLGFVYMGKAPNLASLAREVLRAADKYALETLKAQCERVLCSDLCVENAAETLILADVHSAAALKRRAVSFIVSRYKKVLETKGWKEAIQHPLLLNEVLCALSKR